MTPALRREMGDAAVRAARAAGYRNAGTIEFLLEGDGPGARFYFLEMNTRLQVEHPVTEMVTGLDLVRAQIAVASGEPLPWRQDEITQRGHAIECRLYAEDPWNGFLPQAGRILLYREPQGPGVRVDSGVAEGSDVPVQYDPLLAKLIVCAETRTAAIARAVAALRAYPVLGIRTNGPFLLALLRHPSFAAAGVHTGFVDEHLDSLLARPEPDSVAVAAAAASAAPALPVAAAAAAAAADPWASIEGWR
jgi:acetyl/propionyl-CoA carboxylase alpha subunit